MSLLFLQANNYISVELTSFCFAELSTKEAFHSFASFLPASNVMTLRGEREREDITRRK